MVAGVVEVEEEEEGGRGVEEEEGGGEEEEGEARAFAQNFLNCLKNFVIACSNVRYIC